ncbi:ATP-dependent DNA helicase [Mycena sanguinolenta]|uniref:ATP-dependent DNA helicase n=1 Tax=Mycena sanguinolenta TaxID=230812 RepID=A0A8H6XPQ4_9AGAR|nr:ATP-dependent DNA helicase [Mycena sanguinolenta]
MARTVADIEYGSFQEAARELGLFADRNEATYAMLEAIRDLRTPRELRILFVHLLIHECVDGPLTLWELVQDHLAQDFILQTNNCANLGINLALDDISHLLEEYGKHLSDFGLPEATIHSREINHELLRWSAVSNDLQIRADNTIGIFNTDQQDIYSQIFSAVMESRPLCIFIDGKAGRGKTTLVNALCDKLRSIGRIVPVNNKNEMLESPIDPSDPRGELLKEAALIVWDEAPMANRAVLACVEETCRRIMGNDLPFGGKIIVLLATSGKPVQWNATDPDFAEFVDAIGDGAGPEIALDMLSKVHSASELIDFVYPADILTDAIACLTRSILCPTNEQVDFYNDTILRSIQGTSRTYLAADSLKEVDEQGLTAPDSILDYVAQHAPPGLPPHSLTIKTNTVFRLLRNFSVDRGLVKNVRVVIVQTGIRLITVRLLKGVVGGINIIDNEDILIPRICFSVVLASGHTLLRRQFPLAPAYSTTFNSCQGLTLDVLGVDLTRPVFSHGQLYTALSRIRHRDHAKVRLRPGENTTTNVTYHEILV